MVDAREACRNRLLAALPPDIVRGWLPRLDPVRLELGRCVYEAGQAQLHAYFPTTALVSLLHVLKDGASAEIAVIGCDGIVGIAQFMGGKSTSTRAVVQGDGDALRLPASLLLADFERGEALRHLLLRYTQALMSQVTQTAACNRHHHIDQQLSRWLLLSLDRVPGAELEMTQELIANMLGVRREGVTQAAAKLQRAGVIRYSRGHITVLDRVELERHACECYEAVKREYERLLGDRTSA